MKSKRFSIQARFSTLLAASVLIFFTITTLPVHAVLPVLGGQESPFVAVYEKVAPSVVLITVEGESQRREVFNPWERFFNIPTPREQRNVPQTGIGSGVIINREGHVITNYHVIENAKKIKVKLNDNEEYRADVIGRDPQTDIAVIKLDLNEKLLPAEYVAELGDSDELKPGDYAIAIGNPIGLERTITVGIISALGRHGLPMPENSDLRFQNFIQTDAQINPGNSGGALCDINGRVVGINNMYTYQYAAIGFAIPINLAKSVVNKLIESGEVRRGFVGIQGSDIDKDMQEAMNLPNNQGVLINEVLKGSPADKAGLKHGDIIVELDSKKIENFQDFLFRIAEHTPGDMVNLNILRESKNKSVSMELADRNDYDPVASAVPSPGSPHSWRGINVVGLDSNMAQQYDFAGISKGVVIVRIDDDSPAAEANIREGDVIVEIQLEPVNDVDDFNALKVKYQDLRKNILIYRLRKINNDNIQKGYVAVRKE